MNLMLTLTLVCSDSPSLPDVQALYERAFPENERRPISGMTGRFDETGELLAVLDGDSFIGMVSLLTYQDITHILYFAVLETIRGMGYGSAILRLIHARYPGQRIIADIETPEEDAANNDERKKRILFYQKNGYEYTEIAYHWQDEDYRVLSYGGNVTKKEFGAFWRHFYP